MFPLAKAATRPYIMQCVLCVEALAFAVLNVYFPYVRIIGMCANYNNYVPSNKQVDANYCWYQFGCLKVLASSSL